MRLKVFFREYRPIKLLFGIRCLRDGQIKRRIRADEVRDGNPRIAAIRVRVFMVFWNLQQNSNLSSPDGWSVNSSWTTPNGTNYVNLTSPPGSLFFRLSHWIRYPTRAKTAQSRDARGSFLITMTRMGYQMD